MPNQITYSGMWWLLVAQCMVMLPFTMHLPLWLIPVMLFSAGWRLRILKFGITPPSAIFKTLLLALGLGVLFLSGLVFPSLDAMASLLLLGFAFKALEAAKRRDALIIIFIGFFLVALYFLYNQTILAALYSVVSLLVLVGALISNQQNITEFKTSQQVRFNLRVALQILLQSLPLMLVIFLLIPRLPPLWSLPMNMGQSRTGISDRMAPGEIGDLSQSGELAFRVTFQDKRPTQKELYWRGLVLNHFDGREWRQFEEDTPAPHLQHRLESLPLKAEQLTIQGEPIHYEAVYEPSGKPWLFTLSPVTQAEGTVIIGNDYRVMASDPLQAPLLLKATSYPEALRDMHLTFASQHAALQLPTNNARSRQLAKQWREQVGSDVAYLEKVLTHYRNANFFYTLHPPRLTSANTIDEFLFDSQRGFCEHYAGSFVFLMRAAGIPARIVVGYQGGEWNERGNYLLVHQYDAHAWAEIWLPEQGWVQIDPTAAVAPERVEKGARESLANEAGFLTGQQFVEKHLPWLNTMALRWDALQYQWQRWVLSYDDSTRLQVLQRLLGEVSIQRIALWMIGSVTVIFAMGLLSLGVWRRPKPEALEHQLYQRFCKLLAKQGIQREAGQAPSTFAALAALRLPQHAEAIQAFNRLYEAICYQPPQQRNEQLSALKQQWAKLRSQL